MNYINYQLDNIDDTEFKPYDRYGRYDIIPGLYWCQSNIHLVFGA